jgi:putative ATPase
MADPQALLVAVAAAQAVEHVGLPEAQLNLAQAVVHLATAPKSNRAALGIWNARGDVQSGTVGEVPAHLRDNSYKSAASIGHGSGYVYPHDDPRGWVPQQYVPAEVAGRHYYEPSGHGFEEEVARRMNERSEQIDDTTDEGGR